MHPEQARKLVEIASRQREALGSVPLRIPNAPAPIAAATAVPVAAPVTAAPAVAVAETEMMTMSSAAKSTLVSEASAGESMVGSMIGKAGISKGGAALFGVGVYFAAQQAHAAKDDGERAFAWGTAIPGQAGMVATLLLADYRVMRAAGELQQAMLKAGVFEAGYTSPYELIASDKLPHGGAPPESLSAAASGSSFMWMFGFPRPIW
jgi:hypothetical protein